MILPVIYIGKSIFNYHFGFVFTGVCVVHMALLIRNPTSPGADVIDESASTCWFSGSV
jgi:hypothetical protein